MRISSDNVDPKSSSSSEVPKGTAEGFRLQSKQSSQIKHVSVTFQPDDYPKDDVRPTIEKLRALLAEINAQKGPVTNDQRRAMGKILSELKEEIAKYPSKGSPDMWKYQLPQAAEKIQRAMDYYDGGDEDPEKKDFDDNVRFNINAAFDRLIFP